MLNLCFLLFWNRLSFIPNLRKVDRLTGLDEVRIDDDCRTFHRYHISLSLDAKTREVCSRTGKQRISGLVVAGCIIAIDQPEMSSIGFA
jgi:hypothetical protein